MAQLFADTDFIVLTFSFTVLDAISLFLKHLLEIKNEILVSLLQITN
jgi:hypothetical protein